MGGDANFLSVLTPYRYIPGYSSISPPPPCPSSPRVSPEYSLTPFVPAGTPVRSVSVFPCRGGPRRGWGVQVLVYVDIFPYRVPVHILLISTSIVSPTLPYTPPPQPLPVLGPRGTSSLRVLTDRAGRRGSTPNHPGGHWGVRWGGYISPGTIHTLVLLASNH